MTRNWWNVNPPRPSNLCCDTFWQAMQTGTDNEGVGALINYYNRRFHAGSIAKPIIWCPWCGGISCPPTTPTELKENPE